MLRHCCRSKCLPLAMNMSRSATFNHPTLTVMLSQQRVKSMLAFTSLTLSSSSSSLSSALQVHHVSRIITKEVEMSRIPASMFIANATRRSSAVQSHTFTFAPFHTQVRWASDDRVKNDSKEIDLVDELKPINIRVAEQKDSQIYTYSDYVDKYEKEERAKKAMSETIDEFTDNPMWMIWCLIGVGLAVLTVVISIRIRRERLRFDPSLRSVKAFDSPEGPSIGGPFELTDVYTGKRVTDKDLRGKWLYIYFGFTNCPDVCPEEMAKMARVIRHLDKKVGADYWQPIFISIDPRRDTPAKIREYLADFSPRIMGLVGTAAEVDAAARQYRVYYAVPDEEVMSDEDYLVDHSIIMYLMDPEGKFSDYTTKEFQWFESYSKLLRRMMDYERHKADIQRQRVREGKSAVEGDEREANLNVANVAAVSDEARKKIHDEAMENLPQKAMRAVKFEREEEEKQYLKKE